MNRSEFIKFSRTFLLSHCTQFVADGLEKGDAFDHRTICAELEVADINNVFSEPLLLLLDEVAPNITAIHLIILHGKLKETIDLHAVYDFLCAKGYF